MPYSLHVSSQPLNVACQLNEHQHPVLVPGQVGQHPIQVTPRFADGVADQGHRVVL